MYQPGNAAIENSGSLTGHILSQGRHDGPTPKSRTAKVIVIMLVVLGIMVVGGLVAAIFFRDAITEMLNGLFSNKSNTWFHLG
jgi:hypothetical protein